MVDDGMTTDGPSGETSFNDIVNHGPGLERCSHINKEMEYEDVKVSVPPVVNNCSLTKKRIEHCNDEVTSPNKESNSKLETNGQKLFTYMERTPKKKHNVDDGIQIQTSHPDSTVTENSKDGIQRSSSHGSKNETTVGVNVKKTKKILKAKTNLDVEGKDNVVNNGVLYASKRPKGSDDGVKTFQTYRKSDVSGKGGNGEVKKSTPSLKTKKVQTNGGDSGVVVGDEDALPPTKRRKQAMSVERITESSTPKKGEITQVPSKRRAVRIVDDDEDEPKTPVHAVLHNSSVSIEEVAKVTEVVQDSPNVKNLKPSSPSPLQDSTRVVEGQFRHTPQKSESEKKPSEEALKVLVSPVKSPMVVEGQFRHTPQKSESLKSNKSQGKVSGTVPQKKVQSFKSSSGVSERSRPVVSGDKQKSNRKSTSRVTESSAVSRKGDNNLLEVEKMESKSSESSKSSMRHLIAVAQAKRKQAQSQTNTHDNTLNLTTEPSIRSPNSIPAIQPGIVIPPDQLVSNDHPDSGEVEERRTSSGHRQAGGSLSGGTEAAVARDAFEGMIETLSRTKESIGRATRHAIDCAKHGIANEVVELLTRKLENESSFHRRVDLFFLVDSITQCSHSQKGIAGASYIPTVQAALPRLLGAAAPPGANARENRRQCLKVLKLWLERKILPDTLLRSFIEDIGASNDEVSSGFFSKRPSRSERAVDDPIREMEGMLVDEYGSNATFQLPGFLSTSVFEEDDDDDILNFSKDGNGKLVLEASPVKEEVETCPVTPKRHCILEDVDGELEMEDVSGHPKDEKLSPAGVEEEEERGDSSERKMEVESNENDSDNLSPFREGSPPLPPDSPPPTPPLPSSPLSPEVPPPPSSPPPPPPPPAYTLPSFPPPAFGTMRGEMFPYVAGVAASSRVEYGHETTYTNPTQGAQSLSLGPRPFQQPLPGNGGGQFQYPKQQQQQQQQHSIQALYGLTKPSDSVRRYGGADEQWRPPTSNDFSGDSQRAGAWRISLPSAATFSQEGGYYRGAAPAASNVVGFQPTVPAAAPIPGHMMPGRPDMSSLNSWRPP